MLGLSRMMIQIISLVLSLFLVVVVEKVDGFSASIPPQQQQQAEPERQFVDLCNPETCVVDSKLPATYVNRWATWVLLDQDKNHQENDSATPPTWYQIPDDSNNNMNNNVDQNDIVNVDDVKNGGFVCPTSMNQLWQPLDLKLPDMRLALGFHVRNGILRHVMPSLDLGYTKQQQQQQELFLEEKEEKNDLYYNRGLCTVPRAHQWAALDTLSVDEWLSSFELVLFQRKLLDKKQEKQNDGNEDKMKTILNAEPREWQSLCTLDIADAFEEAVMSLTSNPPEELGEGSHILSIPCRSPTEWLPCPSPGHEIKVVLQRKPHLVDTFKKSQPVGILQVKVLDTAAGSESQYLPNVYKPLFFNPLLRRQQNGQVLSPLVQP